MSYVHGCYGSCSASVRYVFDNYRSEFSANVEHEPVVPLFAAG